MTPLTHDVTGKMATVSVKHVYLSTACNPSPRCLDWGMKSLCFGARNAVLIYNPKEHAIIHTLVSHTKLVNSVKWIKESDLDELISCSVDQTIIIWAKIENNYVAKQKLKEHTGPVTVVNYCKLDDGTYILGSASVDCSLLIWERTPKSTDFLCLQKLDFGNGFALDLTFSTLPNTSDLVLAIARDDAKINLFTKSKDENFTSKMILSGHEDWVRGIDFTCDESGDILLASSSQDSFVRIWRIKPVTQTELIIDDLSVKLKGNIFKVKENEYTVTVESVMAGHENWVHTVQWQPKISSEPLRLISASMDKTLIIWEVDEDSGLWLEKVRMGDVGGNTLGFCNVVFKPDGLSLLAHGYQGSFHLFNFNQTENIWEPGVIIRGHFGEVLDIAWDPEGQYLLSCSLDKTTRLHAPWIRDDLVTWHEIARPQIHGYEMTSLAIINRVSFISGADEKVIRVFFAPKNFVDNFCEITKLNLTQNESTTLAEGASVPSLGLSNKAVFQNDLDEKTDPDERHVKDMYPDFYFTPVTLKSPPTEETLLQNTLFPEIQKLYGHGFEIFCLACNHAGTILASACKATKTEYAAIILWDTKTWKQITQIVFHSLTITQLSFSPNDKYLLSVSRDRVWGLYLSTNEGFIRVVNSDKKTGIHQRIIWSCSWSHDSKYFATVSRDKKMVIWKVNDESGKTSVEPAGVLVETEDSATAVDFAPVKALDDRYILSVGLENGVILIYRWKAETLSSSDFILTERLDQSNGHHLTVKRLRFSPKVGQAGMQKSSKANCIQLASCGSDHFVRIYEIDLEKLISR